MYLWIQNRRVTVSLTFSQSFFEQNVSPTVKIIAIFDVIFESKVTLTATWFYHWRFRRAFSNKMSPYSWNYCDFQRFFFQNKARNAGRSGENTGMREISQNAGFPARLRDGWHLSMVTQVGSFILVYVECKVAIPMVSTRKTDDDHHVADSEAIGRLRHELIKSTGNPRISSGVKPTTI